MSNMWDEWDGVIVVIVTRPTQALDTSPVLQSKTRRYFRPKQQDIHEYINIYKWHVRRAVSHYTKLLIEQMINKHRATIYNHNAKQNKTKQDKTKQSKTKIIQSNKFIYKLTEHNKLNQSFIHSFKWHERKNYPQ